MPEKKRQTLRERQGEETRLLLIAVARQLFADQGFAATSIEDIIDRAGVARGALYHHFPGKEALFRAVYEAVQEDTAARVVTAASSASEPWESVRAGLTAFVGACLEPEFRRIVVLDSVSVLQAGAWEGGVEHIELPMLRAVLTPLVDRHLPDLTPDALAHVAMGGLYGAALYIARSSKPKAAQREVEAVLDTIILGLRGLAG